jgi:hypothetical protein
MLGLIPEYLEEARQIGDVPADRVISEIYRDARTDLKEKINSCRSNADLENLVNSSESISQLIEKIHFPAWADKKLLGTASALFRSHAIPMLGLLGVYSLPYCYAAANGARVLIHSRNIIERPQKRLSETARFVTDLFSEDAFEKTGRGLCSIMKVRLMHGAARFFAGRHIKNEIAVNQEDLAGTNLAFSLICLRGMQKSGFDLTKKEWEAYIHFWNVVGYMLGIEEHLLPHSISEASKLERDIRNHQFTYSYEGEKLTMALVNMLNQQNEFKSIISASDLIYYYLGDEVAGYLGLTRNIPITGALMSAVRVKNFLFDYSSSRYDKIVKLVEGQVDDSNGTYFTL